MSDSTQEHLTAEDIGRRLGVSRSTVAAVMRGQAERQRISAETAARVHAAAREMGYVPNLIADPSKAPVRRLIRCEELKARTATLPAGKDTCERQVADRT